MSDHRITCINKKDRFNSHEHITHIGNPSEGWKITRDNAIQRIENKSNTFFVLDSRNNTRAYVGVVREFGKLPYLRTYADGLWADNLLSLPECN